MQPSQLVELAVGGFATGAIYGLIGLGFSMIIRSTGILHFAQGEIMMLGAMFGWMVVAWIPLSFVVVLLIGMLFSGLASALIYLVVYRAMQVRDIPLMNIVIATIGMSILLQNVSMLIWGSEPMSYPKFFAVETYRMGPVHISPQVLWVFALGFG